jgi:ABC-type branched-subunit amino acid transport system ATPase component
VPRREIVAILGRNGAGKTTLLRSILGLGPVVRGGRVLVDGTDVTARGAAWTARHGVAYAPDAGGAFGTLTVEQNILLGVRRGLSRAETQAAVDEGLDFFPVLRERRKQIAGSMSGGEQRMLTIARAIVTKPRYIMLDEPTEGLHPRVFPLVVESLRKMRDEYAAGVIWVDRRIELALALADRYAVMERGRVVLSGSTATADAAEIAAKLAV